MPYHTKKEWHKVIQVEMDQERLVENGRFGQEVRELNPEVVVNLICFFLESAKQLVDSIEGHIQHFISCGIFGYMDPVENSCHGSRTR